VGFDFGGKVSKVFMLVYGLNSAEDVFQLFPGVAGSFYFRRRSRREVPTGRGRDFTTHS
jgi:hypothetical protein